MLKTVKNCKNLNMETIRLRRGRPSSLALALALAITMLVVNLLSLQGLPREEAAAAAAVQGNARLHLDGLEGRFLLSSLHDDETQARVAAALCAENGGAGLILQENGQYAVVYAEGKDLSAGEEPTLHRSAPGLDMEIEAPAEVISAIADGTAALRALAAETGALAGALGSGESDRRTVSALLSVYKTQLETAADGLTEANHPAAALIHAALEKHNSIIDCALAHPTPGKIRLVHAAACREWIALLNSLIALA